MTGPRPRATRRGVLAAGGLLAGSAVATGAIIQEDDRGEDGEGVANETDGASDADAVGDSAAVYEAVIDGVVLVTVGGVGTEGGGLGSGFVVDDSHLVTNAHVVGEATEAGIQFRDEQWRSAEVVGTDVQSDLAALRVDDLPEAATSIPFEVDPVVGQEVLAIGNPLGFESSVSRGIVSGVDRVLPSPAGYAIPAAIQTDAPVAPGNSGGPLVATDGEAALGVVFAGIGENIAFAISAALADRVIPALIDEGAYDHPYVGVGVTPVDPLVAAANDLAEPRGVLVTEVAANSPAEGVLEPATGRETVDGATVPTGGDVIVSFDGVAIPNEARLASYLALETSPGETVSVEVLRAGDRQTLEVTLGARPELDGA